MRERITRVCLLWVLAVMPLTLSAQRGIFETDIFGDLQFRSSDGRYTASLEEDIFDNLTFTDSRRNEIVFEEEYLAKEYPAVSGNEEARREFFRSILSRHRRDEGYRAKYSVDIFGAVTTEDNRGNRISFGRDLHGDLQYRSGGESASLGKTFGGGKWVYEDSGGNRFEFGERTWNEMIRRHGDDERIFQFLIENFSLSQTTSW